MPIILGVHQLAALPADKRVPDGWTRYCQSCRAAGLKPLGVIYSTEKGVAYCQTEADSVEQVRDAHRQADVPLEDAFEVIALPPR